MAAPCDLNIPHTEDEVIFREQIEMAVRLGYEVLGVNNFVEEILAKGANKKKKEKPPLIKSADEVLLRPEELNKLQLANQQDPAIQSHDIISVQPMTERVFNLACKEMDVDIISLDLTQRLGFNLKRQAIGVAVERGVHFEICYSPMIRDSTARRNIIGNAQNLVKVSKAKNILLSSQCEKAMELRGSYDVANLALLFGMKEAQAKAAVSTNCRSLLLHAAARRSARGVLSVFKTSTLTQRQLWTLREASGVALSDDKVTICDSLEQTQNGVTHDGNDVSDTLSSGAVKHKADQTELHDNLLQNPLKKLKPS